MPLSSFFSYRRNFSLSKDALAVKIAGIKLPLRIATAKNFRRLLKRFGWFLCKTRASANSGFLRKHIIWRGDIYRFENTLRRYYSLLLAHKGGFLLHASGILLLVNSRTKKHSPAYSVIFSGKSTSGKSTIASAFPSRQVLSDELVAIARSKNTYRAYPTPFAGFMMKIPGTAFNPRKNPGRNYSETHYDDNDDDKKQKFSIRGGAPVRYIFFLTRKSAPFKIKAAGTDETYRRILRNVFFLPPDGLKIKKKNAAAELVGNAARFAKWAAERTTDGKEKAFLLESSLKDIPRIKNIVGGAGF